MAQVDWAAFGKLAIGKHSRPLHLFLMVLSYSGRIYGRYFHDISTARVLEGCFWLGEGKSRAGSSVRPR